MAVKSRRRRLYSLHFKLMEAIGCEDEHDGAAAQACVAVEDSNADRSNTAAQDGVAVEDSNVEDQNTVGLGKKKKRGGRLPSPLWALLTDEAQPWQNVSAVCKHCKERIHYHKKSEQVKSHLNTCSVFVKLTKGTNTEDRPTWFTSVKRNKTNQQTLDFGFAKSSPTPPRQPEITEYSCPRMTRQQQDEVAKNLALHYYITGTSFQRVEEPHLDAAFKACRPDVKLPDRKRLSDALLNACFNELKEAVDAKRSEARVKGCISTDGWTDISGNSIVNYMYASQNGTQFLESVATGSQRHTAEWILRI